MRALALALVALLAGCPKPYKPVANPENTADLPNNCAAAATFLDAHKCPEARPDFKDFCVYEVTNGFLLRPSCIALSRTCEEAASCR